MRKPPYETAEYRVFFGHVSGYKEGVQTYSKVTCASSEPTDLQQLLFCKSHTKVYASERWAEALKVNKISGLF